MKKYITIIPMLLMVAGCGSKEADSILPLQSNPFEDNEESYSLFGYPEGDDRHASAYTGYKIIKDSSGSIIGQALTFCEEENVEMASVWYENNNPVIALGDGDFSIRTYYYVKSDGMPTTRDYGSTLRSIKLSKNLRYINDHALEKCTALKSITLPDGVISIGERAFRNCGITSIELPSTVTTIGNNCFAGSSITSIYIPATVTNIGDYAFLSCSNLTTIYCQASSQPSGWSSRWNSNSVTTYSSLEEKIPVIWGA